MNFINRHDRITRGKISDGIISKGKNNDRATSEGSSPESLRGQRAITNDPEYIMPLKERERLISAASDLKAAMEEYETGKLLLRHAR